MLIQSVMKVSILLSLTRTSEANRKGSYSIPSADCVTSHPYPTCPRPCERYCSAVKLWPLAFPQRLRPRLALPGLAWLSCPVLSLNIDYTSCRPVRNSTSPRPTLSYPVHSRDDPSEEVETISHRLQTKKGGNTAGSGGGCGGGNQHPHGAATQVGHGAGAKSNSAPAPPKPAAAGGRKQGSKEKAGAGKTYSFQWDEGENRSIDRLRGRW